VALLAGAVPPGPGTWADVGSGDGTFTRALFELLGPGARIYAFDRDARALAGLGRWAARNGADVISVHADFTGPFELPGLPAPGLDGMLLANSLHFVSDPESVLSRLTALVRPGGRVVIVEYSGRGPNRWVPYPISMERLPRLAAAAGLSAPVITATRPSAFGGVIYAAAADRLASLDPG
jgi:SAM-dependent methyltransferase